MMNSTKHTTPLYVCDVPNNKEGNNLIDQVRKALYGTGLKLVRRGRNPNREQFYQMGGYTLCGKHSYCQDLPLEYATHFGLYLRHTKTNGMSILLGKRIIDNIQRGLQVG